MFKTMFSIKDGVNSTKISCTGKHKVFQMYFGLCLEITRITLSVVLDVLWLLYEMLLQFKTATAFLKYKRIYCLLLEMIFVS